MLLAIRYPNIVCIKCNYVSLLQGICCQEYWRTALCVQELAKTHPYLTEDKLAVASTTPFPARVTFWGAWWRGAFPLSFPQAFWRWLCWGLLSCRSQNHCCGLWAVGSPASEPSEIEVLSPLLSLGHYSGVCLFFWLLVLWMSYCCLDKCSKAWYHLLASTRHVQAIVWQVLPKGLLWQASDTSGRWGCQPPLRYRWS